MEKFLTLFVKMILNLSKLVTILFSLNYFTADFDSSFNFVIGFAIAFVKVDNVLPSES